MKFFLDYVSPFILIFLFATSSVTFSEAIIGKKKVNGTMKSIACVVCSLLCMCFVRFLPVAVAMLLIFCTMLLAYLAMWREQRVLVLFISNAYLVNITSVFLAVHSGILQIRQFNPELILWDDRIIRTMAIDLTCIVLSVMVFFALKFVSVRQIRMVADHAGLRRGMNIWMAASNTFLMFQIDIFCQNQMQETVLYFDLVYVCGLLLAANWAFLFYNIRIMRMLGLEARMERLTRKVKQDAMTGLLNKEAVIHLVNEKIIKGGALLMIDIDNFKQVNDRYGHAEGDLLIRKIAEVIHSMFRAEDVKGRFGGDEFIVFIGEKGLDRELIEKRTALFCRACSEALCVENNGRLETDHSVSVGVALIEPDKCGSFEEAFGYADAALYEAKNAGKNTYRIVRVK